jgi:hypothetical protein
MKSLGFTWFFKAHDVPEEITSPDHLATGSQKQTMSWMFPNFKKLVWGLSLAGIGMRSSCCLIPR